MTNVLSPGGPTTDVYADARAALDKVLELPDFVSEDEEALLRETVGRLSMLSEDFQRGTLYDRETDADLSGPDWDGGASAHDWTPEQWAQ